MQQLDWNGLELILHVARARSLAGAAKQLGVDQTTVSRRLDRFEQEVGTPVFKRTRSGVVPTPDGERLLSAAQGMERELLLAAAQIPSDQPGLSGSVSLTCVPVLASHLIAPMLSDFASDHPSVEVSLFGNSRDFRVRDREADIALRFDKKGADHSVLSRNVASVRYGAYHASGKDPSQLPWIGYATEKGELPQASWIASAIDKTDGVMSSLRVTDTLELLALIENGAGQSFLPNIAVQDNRRLDINHEVEDLDSHTRDLWLLVHPSIRTLPHVDALIRVIETSVNDTFQK